LWKASKRLVVLPQCQSNTNSLLNSVFAAAAADAASL
jgi:hypothetical protein